MYYIICNIRADGLSHMQKQCKHYKNGCTFLADCCNKFYNCFRCHDEEVLHKFTCNDIKCDSCGLIQKISQACAGCNTIFSTYFCSECILFDSTEGKDIYHCEGCKICRIGKRNEYIHCNICRCCLSRINYDGHKCIENKLGANCPFCLEYMYTTTGDISILDCGHALHRDCLTNSIAESNYRCPVCLKSFTNMDQINKLLDLEVQMTLMPEDYRGKIVVISCNDCGKRSEVPFHIVGLKCSNQNCGSYNTMQI
jgi:RING finger/CHY zinc finger protein 1